MLKVVESFHGAYEIFYSGGVFLTDEEVAALDKHLTKLGQHYQVLQNLELASGKTRWKSTQKLHYVVGHLATQARLTNPKFVQGYASESLVGEVCGIYATSQSGPFRRNIQRVSMLKYRVGMKLLWAC